MHHRYISLIALAFLFPGCSFGPERASVEGKVTLDGAPLELGSITLQPQEATKSPSAGGTIKDGVYVVEQSKGPMLGSFRVEIRALRKTGKKIPAGSPAPPGTMVDEYVEAIPAKYNVDTTLTIDVKSGKNVRDFELKSK